MDKIGTQKHKKFALEYIRQQMKVEPWPPEALAAIQHLLEHIDREPTWDDLPDPALIHMAQELGVTEIRIATAIPDARTELLGKLQDKLREKRTIRESVHS
jgi:hypothetical protein